MHLHYALLKPKGQLCLQPTVYILYIYTYNSRLNTFTGYKLLSTPKLLTRTRYSKLHLEAFADTEFNEIFSGRQPLQDVRVFRRFTESPAHPEDGDRVSYRNVRKSSHLDSAVCPGVFH